MSTPVEKVLTLEVSSQILNLGIQVSTPLVKVQSRHIFLRKLPSASWSICWMLLVLSFSRYMLSYWSVAILTGSYLVNCMSSTFGVVKFPIVRGVGWCLRNHRGGRQPRLPCVDGCARPCIHIVGRDGGESLPGWCGGWRVVAVVEEMVVAFSFPHSRFLSLALSFYFSYSFFSLSYISQTHS